MKSLKGSETEKNLVIAFAGESQTRTRYNYFAPACLHPQSYFELLGENW
jgi:hypothetical protein